MPTSLPFIQGKETRLVRGIGRWSLIALVVNFIIGAGIYGLPSAAAGILGVQSPLAYLIAAAGMGIIAACIAEVASRFHQTGGPYLYGRAAFGRFIGLQTGWLLWLTRISSAAAVANVFIDYMSGFWAGSTQLVARVFILTALIGGLAAINIRGLKFGTGVSNFLTVAKLAPLSIFVIAGFVFIHFHSGLVASRPESHPPTAWLSAVLLLVYAFSGFESALIPAGEVQNPSRNIPFALLVAFPAVAILYFLIQYVTVHTLVNSAHTVRPLTMAAQLFGNSMLAAIMSVGALVSTFGSLAANMVANPRITFAFAEQGDFPAWFALVHPRYKTPYVSIVVFAVLLWILAVLGSFRGNATLSAVSRLFAYTVACAALPALRKKCPGQEGFHLAGGLVFSVLGLGFVLLLLSRIGRGEFIAIAITGFLSLLNFIVIPRRTPVEKDHSGVNT